MQSIVCSYCNNFNAPDARFCENCGTELSQQKTNRRAMHNRYTILRSIGKGGMGALYLASETIANRERLVVVKEVIDYFDVEDPVEKEKARRRFEEEAATLASLNVPGVPQLFDYFSEGERNYIVMQFVEGHNLETGLTHLDENDVIVRGRPYPLEDVRSWGVRLCKILTILAAENVIHLDIKPSNLLLDKFGEMWLVDFGTAKAYRFAPPGTPLGMKKSSVYGTMGYAPPEQVAGKPEARSDVFALAATLYHLITDDDPRKNPYDFPKMNQFPKDFADALNLALNPKVTDRITADQFGRLLEGRQTTGPLSFYWRDGTAAGDPRELVALADRNWQEAVDYFKGDAWNKWFKDLHRHDAIGAMHTAKTQHKQSEVALDAFLRSIDPSYPPPHMHVPTTSIDLGIVPWQLQKTVNLEVLNTGGGCFEGRAVSLFTSLKTKPTEFVVHRSAMLEITLDAGALTPSPHQHSLYLTLDAGSVGQVRLPVKVSVPEPQPLVNDAVVRLGTAYTDKVQEGTFQVRNLGNSAFLGEVRLNAEWLSVTPSKFLCGVGKSYDITVRANPEMLAIGEHTAQVMVRTYAGDWEKPLPVQVVLRISAFRSLLKLIQSWFQ